MIIEIQGTNFVNKGAELMLRSATHQIHEWDDRNIVAIRPLESYGDFLTRAKADLYQISWLKHNRGEFIGNLTDSVTSLIPMKYRRLYGLVTYSEVDAILDASGFAFSDQWGSNRSEKLSKNAKKWKKSGKKVILLPQAFGPFDNVKTRDAFLSALENLDLVFARDKVSYSYLKNLGGDLSKIKMAPDFTNIFSGQVPPRYEKMAGRPCIIPNCRMMDKTDDSTKTSYAAFLLNCIKFYISKGMQPFTLIHDTSGDYELARSLEAEIGHPLDIVQEKNATYIKGLIGQSHSVVTSRFHGAVSALSQAVPCLSSGWSHKYEMLFEDYGFSDFCVSPLIETKDADDLLNAMVEEESRLKLRERLETPRQLQKQRTVEMWKEVEKALYS